MDPLHIGHVIGVSGDSIEVQIANAELRLDYQGTTYKIGRLGTYITLPMERVTLIGYVTRVGAAGDLEPGPHPEAPRRITLSAQLLGTVRADKFRRGVCEYPTVGDPVRLAVDEDFELIFGCFDDMAANDGTARRAFSMGRFAVDTDFEVKVLGKEFFAKHLAVMGNSGSGKSVSTTKIIHEATQLPHSQVVMFDMHGEYLSAFANEKGEPLPHVTYLSDRNLVLPYWMLQYDEFEQLFLDTNNTLNVNAQRIFLRQAFERLKRQAASELGLLCELTLDSPLYYPILGLKTYAENMNDARFVLGAQSYAFKRLSHRTLPLEQQEHLLLMRRMEFNTGNAEGETAHATFNGKLLGMINLLESKMNDRRYDFLLRPFEQATRNMELKDKIDAAASPGQISRSVAWVVRQLLGTGEQRRNLTIVDLSGLPFDVVDITVAVMSRTIFNYNFWSSPEQRQPVLMVFEEAHNYLPRRDKGQRMFAREVVEKIAKEGRKYGVSAMIVSQRPSEISETILSQCNTMLLMRMNNPDDQEYAARVVSDQFRSLISLLPSLRPGEAFIIGDAVLMPMRTLITLPPKLPRSADVDFFKLWGSHAPKADNVEQTLDRWWRQDRGNNDIGRRPATVATGPAAFVPEPVQAALADEDDVPAGGAESNGSTSTSDLSDSIAEKIAALAAKLKK